ncbi:cell wall-binding repeat-containing protein [Clostridium kluyveri]|uniref:cell wall-binding repeat-containing protein n=1 Tax=Clostridium kluyveri TaxID=1534 RepID=UPI002245D735|nr:cell wall-binding repeat-containing protein [Clostridium kluyveri]UZQ50380.1 cell wall-binding repeat-containing protein [Clostridium kluyveri]
MKSKKLVSLVLLAGLAASVLGNSINSTVKAEENRVTRIGGQDRYDTAAKGALSNWSNTDNVVLVSGEGYADAISASVLAKKLDAPILLTDSKSLNPYTQSAFSTLKPKNIYIIGGDAVISKEIRELLKKSYNIIELKGDNRYATNAAVAHELVKQGEDASDVILVGGEGFSDALTVASIAASQGKILLIGTNDLNSIKPVTDFINSHKSNSTVVGTTSVINDSTYKAVNGVNRIDGGNNRFDTNLKVLDSFKSDIKFDKVYVASASGNGYADALTASALAGRDNSPLVLVDEENSTATLNALNYLKTNLTSSSKVEILGGTGVVPEAVENKINTLNGSEEQVQTFTGYITTEDDFAAGLKEDSAHMIHMKMMALSGLGITFQENGEWVFYYFDGNISTDNKDGEGGTWIFNGTGSQLDAWNIVEEQIKRNDGSDKMNPVLVTVKGILKGNTQTNPGPDADGKNFPVITVESISADNIN